MPLWKIQKLEIEKESKKLKDFFRRLPFYLEEQTRFFKTGLQRYEV